MTIFEDIDGSVGPVTKEATPLGKYYVPGYVEAYRSFGSLEEAEAFVRKAFKENPYRLQPDLIMKVEKILGVEKPAVEIKEITFEDYLALENKENF